MGTLTTCPTCDGSGVVVAAEPAPTDPQARSARDQTGSDRDQTWADHDQTASDLDQASAAEDQAAADQDLAAGADPALYERSRAARAHTTGTRVEVSRLRDETAAARAAIADERDRVAAERDRDSTRRHELADTHRERIGADVTDALLRAARDRERASAERARAAVDREAAAREREVARLALAEAARQVELAATDELTGALTRRFGFEQIGHELERARRTGGRLTFAFVDVDGLKEVNDRHGHAAGDRLLRLVVETMRAHLRPYDVVMRYGGDEFICVMPNASAVAAEERLAAIATAVAEAQPGHSISFGLAEPGPDDGIPQLIDRADAELLAAKRSRHRRR